jgi:hypothetical protein
MTTQALERVLERFPTVGDALPADLPAPASAGWLRRYSRTLVAVDAAALGLAAGTGPC